MKRAMFITLVLAGCATTPVAQDAVPPMLAIERAAAFAPGGFPGNFVMTVRATGRQDGKLYLNSESDYRDPRNLSIEVLPVAQMQIEQRLGGAPDSVLVGRTIVVDGIARRVRIDFTGNGRPTGKYYYQTHVVVDRGEQLRSVAR